MPNFKFNVVPYLIKGGLHTHTIFSNLVAMTSHAQCNPNGPNHKNEDFFPVLLSSSVRSNIAFFVSSHYQYSISSSSPGKSLQHRLLVTKISLNKAGLPANHESLSIWVFDHATKKTHGFVIERVPSVRDYTSRFSIFSQFPQSQTVLNSIERAILNMRSVSAQAAESLFAAIKTETETIPLLPLTNIHCETETDHCETDTDHCETDTDHCETKTADHDHSAGSCETETIPLLPSNSPPNNTASLIDIVTSTLAQAVAAARSASLSQSFSPQSYADDLISGYPLQTLTQEYTSIRQFKPVKLSLFDVVLLAKVVNEYAPIYGLFDNHCFMFASVMFDSIVQLYSIPASARRTALHPDDPSSSTSSGPVPAPTPEVDAPKNANIVVLPRPDLDSDQAGRWSGLLILDPIVKATIVGIVISRFEAERVRYMENVSYD